MSFSFPLVLMFNLFITTGFSFSIHLWFLMVFEAASHKLPFLHSSRNNNPNDCYPEKREASDLAWWNTNWVFLLGSLAQCWLNGMGIHLAKIFNHLSSTLLIARKIWSFKWWQYYPPLTFKLWLLRKNGLVVLCNVKLAEIITFSDSLWQQTFTQR